MVRGLTARAGAAWDRFWFSPVDARPLAAARILLGLFLVGYFLALAPHVEVLFSDRGVYLPVLVPDIAPPPPVAWAVFLLTLAACAAFAAGWRTRLVAPAVLVLFAYHWALNLAVRNTAYDRLILLLLGIAWLAPLDAAWAVRPTGGRDGLIPAWGPRLLGLQLSLLYLGSGVWKLLSASWRSADMLPMTLAGPWGSPLAFDVLRLGAPRAVWLAVTLGVVAFELVAGFTLWAPRLPVRVATMAAGAAFHVGVALLLSLPQFLVCLALYPLFLRADELERLRVLVPGRRRRVGEAESGRYARSSCAP